ncbi:MAG: FKBP-type peptidyl-prolyl cis-trans isomerase [Proteobacteria bacterium]|nr:FKBP-type peptidyl-prolyl cis-trans isomerase [Pseudomonadota bacterium]
MSRDRLHPTPAHPDRSALRAACTAAFLVVVLCPVAPAQADAERDKALYAMGAMLGRSLEEYELSPEDLKRVQKGLSDQMLGRDLEVDSALHRTLIQDFVTAQRTKKAALEKKAAAGFLAEQAAQPGAVRTDSGLVLQELKAGSGASPGASDTVKVHYHGTFRDGTVFDSSVERGSPAEFPLNRVIRCWTEALQLMKVGQKSRITCPSDIAYGDRGSPPRIPGGATLVFEVELLEIVSK